jgi:hypothetical protein
MLPLLIPAALVLLCVPALAQDSPATTVATHEQTTTQPLPGRVDESPAATTADDWWEFVGGYETGVDTGYGFAGPSWHHPLRDDLTFEAQLYATHLDYEFANADGGRTHVDGPGLAPAVGLRFGSRNWFRVMGGLEIRSHGETISRLGRNDSEFDETRVGLDVGADAWLTPSDRSNVHAMVHYGTASEYLWGRVAAKHQVSNFDGQGGTTLSLGGELIGQGNDDIRSTQVGALAEVFLRSAQLSLTARGGYKKSTFDVGDDDTGTYFGVGIWKRF